jgi:hypothetical protein
MSAKKTAKPAAKKAATNPKKKTVSDLTLEGLVLIGDEVEKQSQGICDLRRDIQDLGSLVKKVLNQHPWKMDKAVASFDNATHDVVNAIARFTNVITGQENLPQNLTNLCETILQHCCTLVEGACGKEALDSRFLRSKDQEDALKAELQSAITKAIEGLKL